MSEEEKIIENVKQTIEEYEEVIQEEQEKGNVEDVESGIEIKQAIQGLLDLYTKQKQNIDKLQKENEILKYENKQVMETGQKAFIDKFMNNEFISKDKIRNKIKEQDERDKYKAPPGWELERAYARRILKELLGE